MQPLLALILALGLVAQPLLVWQPPCECCPEGVSETTTVVEELEPAGCCAAHEPPPLSGKPDPDRDGGCCPKDCCIGTLNAPAAVEPVADSPCRSSNEELEITEGASFYVNPELSRLRRPPRHIAQH